MPDDPVEQQPAATGPARPTGPAGPTARETLAPHLPYLRRHARALAGSQQRGDHYVRAALEAVLAQPDLMTGEGSSPMILFRLFHRFWGPVNGGTGTGTINGTGNGEALARCGREALLLTAVEGFAVDEAATILDMAPDAVRDSIASARAEIAGQIRSRVLVIEDEPVISMHIEQIVEDMGHQVVATAMTRSEALAEARRMKPDLVLADIQLADGSSGVDAVADILDELDVPVVFITAYPERLLTGERREPTFLVTKPFEADTVVATVGHALLARRSFQMAD